VRVAQKKKKKKKKKKKGERREGRKLDQAWSLPTTLANILSSDPEGCCGMGKEKEKKRKKKGERFVGDHRLS